LLKLEKKGVSSMAYKRFACMHSGTERARQGHAVLCDRYEFVPVKEADAVIALGGDGFMLQTLHQHMDRDLPI
jgi:NAD+ kinase